MRIDAELVEWYQGLRPRKTPGLRGSGLRQGDGIMISIRRSSGRWSISPDFL